MRSAATAMTPERAFDMLSYEEQVNGLKKAKTVIEGVAGRVESFRAPMLRINEATVRALEEAGFKTDSSVASQRYLTVLLRLEQRRN